MRLGYYYSQAIQQICTNYFLSPRKKFSLRQRERIITSRVNNCREFADKKAETAKGFPGIR